MAPVYQSEWKEKYFKPRTLYHPFKKVKCPNGDQVNTISSLHWSFY